MQYGRIFDWLRSSRSTAGGNVQRVQPKYNKFHRIWRVARKRSLHFRNNVAEAFRKLIKKNFTVNKKNIKFKLTFSSIEVKLCCSLPSLFITCATPMTSPAESLIGMHRRALVLYPVCISTSRLKRSSWNDNKNVYKSLSSAEMHCAMQQHPSELIFWHWLMVEFPSCF